MNDDSPPGPMYFQPGYNLAITAKIKYSYWVQKVDPISIEFDNGGDWLVGILDRDMEESNGVFGLQAFQQQWSGQDLWHMLGYPQDMDPDARQQVYQGPISVIDTTNAEHGEIYTVEGFTQPGDTGAAIFGNFPNNISKIIGVNSGGFVGYPFEIVAHGGQPMVDLVTKAIAENP
jgi:hypothetical protein